MSTHFYKKITIHHIFLFTYIKVWFIMFAKIGERLFKENMKITDKLDILMSEKKINRADLARNSDVPYTTIVSLYEKGYDNVKLSTLKKIAQYLDCSIDYLADDNVNDRYLVTHISEKDLKRAELYEKARSSDDPALKALIDALDKILKLD